MAAAAPDRKAYLLDKYLRPRASKKRSKRHARGTGLKIIDDDIDTSKLQPLDDNDLEALAGDEDAPQIAGIIDERPDEVKKMEQFQTSSKWRVVTQDDGFDSKVQIEEIKKNITKTAEDSNPMFGKMYSDSEDEKKDSDLSPPRKTEKTKPVSSKKNKIHQNSDSDLSPPRHESRKKSSDRSPVRISKKSEHTMSKKDDRKQSPVRKRKSPEIKSRNSSDSDLSPPRKHENKTKERERKPSRWGHFGPEKSNKTHREKSVDSDLSPPRKSRRDDNSGSKSRKEKRHDKSSDSDLSPPRKSKKDANNDHKSIKSNSGHRKFGDTDLTRKLSRKSPNRNNYNSESPPRKVNNRDRSIDSDLSPPRRSRNDSPRHSRPLRSPDRIKSNMIDDRQSSSKHRNERPRDSAKNNERARYNHGRRNSNSPPPSNKKMAKTLEGKLAGLQDAKQMRNENEEFKRREDELYSKMSADASGKHATTVNRRLGKRETSADKEKNREQQERRRELEEKYSKWGKGLKQVEEQQARVADYLVEASKPLARHRDDATLESTLKQQERAGDPMLQYMREKKKDRNDAPERPMYKGDWPPNRFNIRPGYRWDGVDRSNGYEKKLFDSRSKAKAMAEEAYKWSTEDL